MPQKKRTIGEIAIAAIKAGKNNDEALAAVKKEYPNGRTSKASINWYRRKLRSQAKQHR